MTTPATKHCTRPPYQHAIGNPIGFSRTSTASGGTGVHCVGAPASCPGRQRTCQPSAVARASTGRQSASSQHDTVPRRSPRTHSPWPDMASASSLPGAGGAAYAGCGLQDARARARRRARIRPASRWRASSCVRWKSRRASGRSHHISPRVPFCLRGVSSSRVSRRPAARSERPTDVIALWIGAPSRPCRHCCPPRCRATGDPGCSKAGCRSDDRQTSRWGLRLGPVSTSLDEHAPGGHPSTRCRSVEQSSQSRSSTHRCGRFRTSAEWNA